MARKSLPKLGQSLRFYVENTLRARIRRPAVERYASARSRRRARLLQVVIIVAAAVALLAFLALI